MNIKLIEKSDWEQFRALRQKALTIHPASFAASWENEEEEFDEEVWLSRIGPDIEKGSFIVGAYDDDILVGSIGLKRDNRIKMRHKGLIWCVYIENDYRGKNLGEALFTTLFEEAKKIPFLEMLYLSVGEKSSGAKKLYTRVGFEEYGTELRSLKIGDEYISEDWMWKSLR